MAYSDANFAGQGVGAESQARRGRALWITFGVITLAIGLAVLLWPGLTLLTVAVLVGVQMIVTGVFWLVSSFAADALGRQRWLLAVAGLLALVAGILCLRAPFQTIEVLALLLGATWVVGGVAEVFHGFGARGRKSADGWAVFSGVVTAIGGIVVLVWPVAGLIALVWLFAIVLLVFGALAIAGAVSAERAPKKAAATASTGTAATA